MSRAIVSFGFAIAASVIYAQGTQADYDRSEQLAARFRSAVDHVNFGPQWLEGGKYLWYTVETGPNESETILVNAKTGTRSVPFDRKKLAASAGVSPSDLRVAIDQVGKDGLILTVQGKHVQFNPRTYELKPVPGAGQVASGGSLKPFLPVHPSGSGGEAYVTFENKSAQTIDIYWVDGEGRRTKYHTVRPGNSIVQHTFADHVWLVTSTTGEFLAAYSATEGSCTAVWDGNKPTPPPDPEPANLSTNKQWVVRYRKSNVFLHPTKGGEDVELSTDGKPSDAYGGEAVWSPDGNFVAVQRTEPEQEHKVYIVRSSPKDQLQPKLITEQYLKPGDRIAHPRVVIFDVRTKKQIALKEDLTPNPWDFNDLHWSPDSKTLYFSYNQRGHQILRLLAADAETGAVRTVVEDKSPTFIDYAAKYWLRYLDNKNQAIWMSERSGYNHLYLVDLKTGATKPITSGKWMVRSVDDFNEQSGDLLLRIMGIDAAQDPYYFHYAKVKVDGSGFTRLTEGDGTHRLTWSPDKQTFIDTYSRVDMAPVSELRSAATGKKLVTLEVGDTKRLEATGWQRPERFVAKGRDGKTDIYGVIYRPTNFDPTKKYPIIEDVYAGPQDFFTPKAFSPYTGNMALSELGFIVVKMDGMGTDWRGKAFHDVCYKNLGDGGFPDRILWMKAANKDRPWMDIDKVGVYGTSAGGQNAASAVFRFGDFYKAAVSDCGCQDNRMDKIWWNELWMGWPVDDCYAANSNVTAAKNLKGALYLMVGEVDNNVDPASTLQVANALIEAGKDFDYLVAPNTGHGVLGLPYARRRMMDFFVRHLYGLEPRR